MSWKPNEPNEEDLPQPALNLYCPQQTGQENAVWIPSVLLIIEKKQIVLNQEK